MGVQGNLAFLTLINSFVVVFLCHVAILAVLPVWRPGLIDCANNPVVPPIKPFISNLSCHTPFNRHSTMLVEHLDDELPEEVQVRLLDTTDRLT